MKMKNNSKLSSRIMSAMLAMILCIATSVTAFAGTGGTVTTPATAELTKYLEYANVSGLTTPGVTFTFDFAAKSKDGDSSTATTSSMPSITSATATFAAGATPTVVGGMNQVSATSGNVLAGVIWTATGVYEYTVTESASGFSGTSAESMNYSLATYTLTVVVSYDSGTGQYFVEETYINQVTNNTGGTGGGKGGTTPGSTGYNFEFTNTYSKLGGSTPGSDALTISKTTTGTGSDPTKQFSFTITADDSVTGSATRGSYTGTIYNSSGTSTGVVTLTADGSTSTTFTLSDGDYIVFDTLPVGTTFTVIETGATGYLPTYSGTTAAGSINSPTSPVPAAGANLSTGSQTIGAINNVVNYTNTYDSSLIPTGVLSNIAPFLAIIAVAVIAFVAFAAMNRRKASR